MSLADLVASAQGIKSAAATSPSPAKVTGLAALVAQSQKSAPVAAAPAPTPLAPAVVPAPTISQKIGSAADEASTAINKSLSGIGSTIDKIAPDNSTAGVVKNTIEGLPKAALDVTGPGQVIDAINADPETASKLTFGDVAEATPKAIANQAASMALDFAGKPINVNLPYVGQVSNIEDRAKTAVLNGENPYETILKSVPGAIFDGLMIAGVADKLFSGRPIVRGAADLTNTNGIKPVESVKSFRLNNPADTSQQIPGDVVQKMAVQKGFTLPDDFDPKQPTYFRIKEGVNGHAIGEVVQIRPSYFDTFVNKLKGNVSEVPDEQVKMLYSESKPAQDIINSPEAAKEAVAGSAPKSGLAKLVEEANGATKQTPAESAAPEGTNTAPIESTALKTPPTALNPGPVTANGSVEGAPINNEFNQFAPEAGGLGIPRAEMPQVAAEHRGALTQFLKAQGIDHEPMQMLPGDLKPTQNEYSPAKVEKARNFEGGNRSILVSGDNHVVDGHHQWMAALNDRPNEPMDVIKLHAPIRHVISKVNKFPSATGGAAPAAARAPIDALSDVYKATGGKAHEALEQLLTEMDLSEAGRRISVPSKIGQATVRAIPSTFPKWVPEDLRSKALFDKVIPNLDNLTYPKGSKQQALFHAILNELDDRLGTNTSEIRNALDNENTKEKNAVADSGSAPGSKTADFDPREEADKIFGTSKASDVSHIEEPEERLAGVILASGLDPGLGKALTEDIIPKSKAGIKFARATFKHIATLFNPAGQAPTDALTIIMKNKGQFEKEIFRLEQATKKIKAMWDKQPEAARLDFMAKIENGESVPPQFKELGDMYRTRLDNAHAAITKYKDINFLENFFPHFWEKPGDVEKDFMPQAFAKRPLQGSKPFTKQRIFKTIEEGIKAGYKPVSTNPEELTQLYETNVKKFVMAQQIKDDSIEKGIWKLVRPGDKPPENFARIDDAIAKIYYKADTTLREYTDQIVREKLEQVAKGLGISHERVVGKSKGMGPNTAGISSKASNEIKTRFGTPERVLAHEIGHQIDRRYGLEQKLVNNPIYAKELRALADERIGEGGKGEATPYYRQYVRKGPEKMAVMFEAFLHSPELFKSVAPTVYSYLEDFLDRHDELRPLLDIKPSLVLGMNKTKIDGPIVSGGEYYAQEDAARLINNYLSKDHLMDSPIGQGLMNVKNTLNAFELGFSAFHLTMETLDTVTTQVAIGMSRIVSGNALQGLKDIIKAPTAPYKFFIDGQKFFNNDPQLKAIEDAIFTGGASFREKQYYKNTALDNFIKNVHQGNYVGATLRAPMAAIEATMRPLFGYYIPRLKVGTFRALFASELERQSAKIQAGKITQEEVARNVWNNVENRMGELNYDNLFWNRNLKTVLMLTTRAVGWNLGTVREIGGGILQDTPREFAKVLKGNYKEFEFTPKMSYTLALFMVIGTIGAIYQYLHTGKMPESVKDLYYPRNGATDKSGQPYRIEFPSYLKDLYQSGIPNLAHGDVFGAMDNATQTIKNKSAPEFSTILELLNNKDFYGNYIRNTNDNNTMQAKQVALFLADQLLPFTVSNVGQLNAGKADLEEKVEAFFGLMKAPKEIIQSDYEKALDAAYENQIGQSGPKTPEQQAAANDKISARSAIKNGDYSAIGQMIKNGIITAKGAKTFIRNAQLSTDQRMYNGLKKTTRAAIGTPNANPDK